MEAGIHLPQIDVLDQGLTSAYNTDRFAYGLRVITAERRRLGRTPVEAPAAVVTMWTWITAGGR